MKMEQSVPKRRRIKFRRRGITQKKTGNTLRLGYTNESVNREIIAVCSQIHTKHINTLCGQNVELLNVKPGGTYSDHWA